MVRGDGHDRPRRAGSWRSFLCLGPGWASAGNTPFRRHKIWVHEGGISTPLIVHWPKGIAARGELRHDPGHVIDFVPTLLELAGQNVTEQWNGADGAAAAGPEPRAGVRQDGTVARDFLFFQHEGNAPCAWATGRWSRGSRRPTGNSTTSRPTVARTSTKPTASPSACAHWPSSGRNSTRCSANRPDRETRRLQPGSGPQVGTVYWRYSSRDS